MKFGRRSMILFGIGAVVVCLWCSALSAVGGWITGQDIARREAQQQANNAALPELGVLVTRVVRGGPAEQAGVQRGDMLVAINSLSVQDARDMRDRLSELRPGDSARISVLRDRIAQEVTVQLGAFPGEQRRSYLGIYFTARAEEPADL